MNTESTSDGPEINSRLLTLCSKLPEIGMQCVPTGRARDFMQVSRHVKRFFERQKLPIALKANPAYTFDELLPVLQSCSDVYEIEKVKIRNITLDQQQVQELLQCLHRCTKMVYLELSYIQKNGGTPFDATFVNDECASEQTAAVRASQASNGEDTLRFPSLLHLNLDSSGNRRCFHFVNIVTCLLGRCKSLTHLNLSWCWRNEEFGQGNFFLDGLTKCTSLVSLKLTGNGIGDKNMESLAVALAQCPALTHLALNANRITPLGVPSLARILVQNKSLSHLDVGSNYIRDEGLEHLAHALGQCKTLAHLKLSDNELGPSGAEHLAAVLWQCPLLAHLNLSSNEIDDEGTQKLAEVLPKCQSLAHLDLKNNWIGSEGLESLVPVLGKCASLKCLILNYHAWHATRLDRLRAVAAHVDIKFY
jgi:hypothetical protein